MVSSLGGENMFIVEWVHNSIYRESKCFDKEELLLWIVELSKYNEDFEIIKLYKYKEGKLTPYQIGMEKGRIIISPEETS